MTPALRDRSRLASAALALSAALLAASLAGCAQPTADSPATTTETAPAAAPIAVKIGTLATEDSLPLWVAEERGYFAVEKLPKVEVVVFQSAQERDAALASGAIDGFMGDMIAAANLEAGGTPVTIETIMLGSDQSQGRFGIVTAPKSGIANIEGLANVPVGTSSATIQEYVLDGLMAEAGIPADQVKKEEVKKVPVRFELLMQNKLKAAAFPEPFLTLAEQGGAELVADDTAAKTNLSQTVLLLSDEFLAKEGGQASADALLGAWDAAVAEINADPNAFRETLVEKARLPEPLAKTYEVNNYPTAQAPSRERVDAVLSWMKEKGYLTSDVAFEDLVGGQPSQ